MKILIYKISQINYFRILISIITPVLFFIILSSTALPDNQYPFSYYEYEHLHGGEVIITNTQAPEEKYQSYFIKPNWSEEADAIYTWIGLKRQYAHGASIGSAYIIANYPLNTGILSIWKDNNRFFVAVIDSNLAIVNPIEITVATSIYFPNKVHWLGKTDTDEIGFLLNQNFFICKINNGTAKEVKLISSDVLNAVSLYSRSAGFHYKAAYMVYRGGSGIVNFLGRGYEEIFSARLPISEDIFMQEYGSKVAIISYSKSYPNSLVKIVDAYRGVIAETWIETSGDRIKIFSNSVRKALYYIKSDGYQYNLNFTDLNKPGTDKPSKSIRIPQYLIEPIGIWVEEGKIIILFRNGLTVFNDNLDLISVDFFSLGEYFGDNVTLTDIGDYIILSNSSSSVILKRIEHNFWIFNRFFANFGKILLPAILILLLLIIFNGYRYQKTLLLAVLNLPAAGAAFILDKYARLTRANSSGKKLLGITDSVPMGKVFRYYCEFEHTKPVIELIDKAMSTRDTFTQKVNIVRNNDMNEWFFTVIPLRNSAGLFKGFVVTGIDITEQLERKRLSNWAQLAHDMQTNLSTIRLNAEQFEIENGSVNSDRRKKILHQVNLLIQRVRDVVTVGRSDSVNKELVDAFDICNDVRNEFDSVVFPHVSFFLEIQHFNVFCDKPKMIRAVRNAVENGIKSMQGKTGNITIRNWNDSRYVYIGIQDTGAGMDEVTKKKMLTPYFTTAKQTGGAGIGTMIMQHVAELHGGEIQVQSEKGKGTQIIFCIPNYAHNKTSKAIAEKMMNIRGDSRNGN